MLGIRNTVTGLFNVLASMWEARETKMALTKVASMIPWDSNSR